MIKKLIYVSLMAIILVVGCSNYEVEVKQKETKASSDPFEVYDYTDEDGCEYIVVYEEKGFNGSYAGGVGLGITAKVNQPEKCRIK